MRPCSLLLSSDAVVANARATTMICADGCDAESFVHVPPDKRGCRLAEPRERSPTVREGHNIADLFSKFPSPGLGVIDKVCENQAVRPTDKRHVS
jgi:hypothetical protein